MAKIPGGKRKGKKSDGFTPVEEGTYGLLITKAEVKSTKGNKANKMVALTFKILKGENKGKTITGFYNVVNDNDQAQRIGKEQLDDMAFCCGIKSYSRGNSCKCWGSC